MTTPPAAAGRRSGRRSAGFGSRLLAAQAIVVVGGAISAWLVAAAVAPGLFHNHLQQAGIEHVSTEAAHVEEAFTSAMIISLAIALVVSALMALAVSWYFTRRVQRSVTGVATSATEIAGGHYDVRLPGPGLGHEFDQLAETFNKLADRLDSVETTRRRMLSDLAHEMRTPLATLDAHIEALEDGIRVPDAETLAVLRSSTARLGRLAEDMGAVSRAEEGRLSVTPVRTDTRSLVDAAVRVAADRFAAKGVALVEDVEHPDAVTADPDRIGQVLGNLLDNALRHTPTGGTVTLAATTVDSDVEITVTDTGDGIAPEHLRHLFDRFYRADPSRRRQEGGSGIGLTIARALVEAHGGTLTASSGGPGTGARFTVRLPATAAAGARSTARTIPARGTAQAGTGGRGRR
ncbi:sensor histidine kinase [Rhodococcus rhodochrous]|uniref:histidine kinase n=1 Tax=Rhodococcus rhodochrous KG-21 TaxID=1441923 RepID=A0A0M9WP77_RHORH|nr:HAMP domain-containing sensor histidine kinase [Rhodococcus rhodochrous]KOS56411.1 histidine kinase [Rhodococcus rhodochrous KG-21]